MSKYNKEYYEKNKEKIKEHQNKYNKENREKINESQRERYKNNDRGKKDKEYRYKNIDKYREYWKKQNQKRREIKERKKFLDYLIDQMINFEKEGKINIYDTEEDKLHSALSILIKTGG